MSGDVTKAEFAAIIGVNRSRVTQMITEGKISGDALVGEGRKAKVNVDLAKAQIRARTDLGQSLGNGLTTLVHDVPEVAAPEPSPTTAALAVKPPVEDEFRKAKLEEVQRKNRREAEDEAARRGRYVLAADVKPAMAKLASEMLNVLEGSIKPLADELAAKFNLPQRDVTHTVRAAMRVIRLRAADAARKKAVDLPEIVPDAATDVAA